MKERLKLVRDFAELRTGMIVVGKPCYCGGAHRGMLLSRQVAFVKGRNQDVFEITPTPHRQRFCIIEENVERGKVWRIVDGLDLGAEPAERRRARA